VVTGGVLAALVPEKLGADERLLGEDDVTLGDRFRRDETTTLVGQVVKRINQTIYGHVCAWTMDRCMKNV
jgi:hypothetical protein